MRIVRLMIILMITYAPSSKPIQQCDYGKADIEISFEQGDHGDGRPFDGASLSSTKILAHAFPPLDGRLHVDVDQQYWVVGLVKNSVDMKSIALHELGHILGLAHSSNNESIMFPIMPFGLVKSLNDNDVN
ncbi:hypothetical protein Patl1_07786 [Pistacia atlantica]|uniref:Uncharacterized protein n=1 Tax=Pistacia atlantica TaxID=434234 RepID=A0ACC1AJ23_9ROSI|nr:hypothetical protein Patl1_07786 [Pistacia atlantica]